MTEWNWCDRKGQPSKHDVGFQMDEVGNILQRTGAVKTKACQKCKKEFNPLTESVPITQKVPFYKCEDCNFENAGGEAALDHKLTNSQHHIKKTSKDRIVTYKNIIKGNKANITKIDDDKV